MKQELDREYEIYKESQNTLIVKFHNCSPVDLSYNIKKSLLNVIQNTDCHTLNPDDLFNYFELLKAFSLDIHQYQNSI